LLQYLKTENSKHGFVENRTEYEADELR
jgi:hypothetical protein